MLKRIFNRTDQPRSLTPAVQEADQYKEALQQAIEIAQQELISFNKKKHAKNEDYLKLQKEITHLRTFIPTVTSNSLKDRFNKQLYALELEAESLVSTVQQTQEQETTKLKTDIQEAQASLLALVDDSEENILLRPILQQQIDFLTTELNTLTKKHVDTAEEDILIRISTNKKKLIKYLADKIAFKLQNQYINKLDIELQEITHHGIEAILVKRGLESPIQYATNTTQSIIKSMMQTCTQQFLEIFDRIKNKFTEDFKTSYEPFYNEIDVNYAENEVNTKTSNFLEQLIAKSQEELKQQEDIALEPINKFIKKSKATKKLEDIIRELDEGIANSNRYLTEPKFLEINNDYLSKQNIRLDKESYEKTKELCQLILSLDLHQHEGIEPIFKESENIIKALYKGKNGSHSELARLKQDLSNKKYGDGEILEIAIEICNYTIKIQEIKIKIQMDLLREKFSIQPSKQHELASASKVSRISSLVSAPTFLWASSRFNMPLDQHLDIENDNLTVDINLEANLIEAYESYIAALQQYHDFLIIIEQEEPNNAAAQSKALLLILTIYYKYACIPNNEHKEKEYQLYLNAYSGIVEKYVSFHHEFCSNQYNHNKELHPEAVTLNIIALMLGIFKPPSVLKEFPSIIDDFIKKELQQKQNEYAELEVLPIESMIDLPLEEEDVLSEIQPEPKTLPASSGLTFKEKLAANMSSEQRELFLKTARVDLEDKKPGVTTTILATNTKSLTLLQELLAKKSTLKTTAPEKSPSMTPAPAKQPDNMMPMFTMMSTAMDSRRSAVTGGEEEERPRSRSSSSSLDFD